MQSKSSSSSEFHTRPLNSSEKSEKLFNMEEEVSGQTALWLQEIESVDYWGPTFRAIYENGVQVDFMAR